VPDPRLQDRVGRQADGILHALGLEQLVDLGLGEAGVTAGEAAAAVAGDDRCQHRAPIVSAVNVVGAPGAALEIPELVADGQRMVAV
jgi:hypothetical protein